MSKEFYWFNEETNNVQNFYFNDWEYSSDKFDENTSVTVGVILFKTKVYNYISKCIIFVRSSYKKVDKWI